MFAQEVVGDMADATFGETPNIPETTPDTLDLTNPDTYHSEIEFLGKRYGLEPMYVRTAVNTLVGGQAHQTLSNQLLEKMDKGDLNFSQVSEILETGSAAIFEQIDQLNQLNSARSLMDAINGATAPKN